MDKIKLTIQEEKELIYDAIEKQVCELNEYPYIYSVITFGFHSNNGDRLPPDTIRKFWDKYEVERTCRLIYNLIKENLKTLQIYSFIERHEELLDGNGEHIKDGRFHINLISTDIRAPRKIGPAESIGQGRRLLGQESQSVLPGQTGIFRGALK